mgnify:CR=1 FL=1
MNKRNERAGMETRLVTYVKYHVNLLSKLEQIHFVTFYELHLQLNRTSENEDYVLCLAEGRLVADTNIVPQSLLDVKTGLLCLFCANIFRKHFAFRLRIWRTK